MSVAKAVRSDTCAAYRRLLAAVHQVTRDCPLHQTEGLAKYVGARFFDAAERNRRHFLHMREKASFLKGKKRQRQHVLLEAQYKKFVAKELQKAHEVTEQLLLAPGNRALTSMLQVLAAGIGNAHFRQMVEQNYAHYCRFESKKVERDEVEEESVAERQNRIMQHALIPYGERLLFLHRLGHVDDSGALHGHGCLAPRQVTEAIVGTRSGVLAHHISHGKEDVVLEVDETYNKQTVYVRCALYDWTRDVERVEITEAEEVRGTVFNAEYLSIALRLCDALVAETPLHAYRSTVLVGHGVGGAVAFCMALLLHTRGFDVKNCVTFGSPKAVQRTLERYVHAINPIRVVLEGDPLIELPLTGAENDPLTHYGEILVMTPVAQQRRTNEGESDAHKNEATRDQEASGVFTAEALGGFLDSEERLFLSCKDGERAETNIDNEEVVAEETTERCRLAAERYAAGFLPEHYIECLLDTTVQLTYAEGDEVWDEGEHAQMLNSARLQSHVRVSQQWHGDTKSPL